MMMTTMATAQKRRPPPFPPCAGRHPPASGKPLNPDLLHQHPPVGLIHEVQVLHPTPPPHVPMLFIVVTTATTIISRVMIIIAITTAIDMVDGI